VIAPLLRERSHEALRELETAVCAPKSVAVIVTQAPESGQNFGQTRDNKSNQSTKDKLPLIQAIEQAREELLRAEATGTSEDQLTVWTTLIAPLIDNAIKLLKQNERNSLDFMEKVRDGFLGTLEQVGDKDEKDLTNSDDISGALRSLTDYIASSCRHMGRRERTRLSTLRYDPYAQLPECRLNEIALDLKLHGVEIAMDAREPVVPIGEDDLKAIVSFYASRAQEWLTEIHVQMFNELIDPVASLHIQDKEAFRAHCDAIRDQGGITCSILGCGEIQLTARLPVDTTIDMRHSQRHIEELLAPVTPFTGTLGVSHRIEFDRQSDAILVKLTLLIPTDNSRYEPKDFSARQLDLERLQKPTALSSREASVGDSPDGISPELADLTESFLPNNAPPLVLSATRDTDIFVPQETIEVLAPTELFKLLRIVDELKRRQPSIIHGVINVSSEGSFTAQVIGVGTPIIYLNEMLSLEGNPLDRCREFLERKRTSTERFDPSEEINAMARQVRPSSTAFRGAIRLDTIDLVLQQIADFPQYITCRNVRLKLFELPPNIFHSVIRLITDIKERLRVPGVTLCEIPPEPGSRASLEQLSYILLTNDEIPIATLAVSQQRDEVLCKPFDTGMLHRLQYRVMAGLQQVHQLPTSRVRRREVEQAMVDCSLDLSDTLIDELIILANSWRGKEIPASRVSLLLNSHLLDPCFSVTEDSQIIRYLHEAERESIK
jgi:hypothetical protein